MAAGKTKQKPSAGCTQIFTIPSFHKRRGGKLSPLAFIIKNKLMRNALLHKFHIPVMGIGFTIDTPIKVARFGISSVISIVEDELIEQMRKFHCRQSGEEYVPIKTGEEDFRARRITAYLNLVHCIVQRQTEQLRQLPFEPGTEIVKYFELLPEDSPAKKIFTAKTIAHLDCGRLH
jgi:hypothetical protein